MGCRVRFPGGRDLQTRSSAPMVWGVLFAPGDGHNAILCRRAAMTAPAPVKLITIDLDDTLWPCEPPIRLAEAQLLAWLASVAPRLAEVHDQSSLRQHRLALMRERADLAHDVTALRRESLRLLLDEFGYPHGLAAEGVAVFMEARNRVEPYPEVASALGALAGRYCLVSVTNGNSDLDRTPLRGLFHHSLTAAGVGAAKPDPAVFLRARPSAVRHPGRRSTWETIQPWTWSRHKAWGSRRSGSTASGGSGPRTCRRRMPR